MQLRYLFVSLAMLSATHHASATTTDWAAHKQLEISTGIVATGSFSDVINFTLDHADLVSSTTVANNLTPLLNITDGKVSLYEKATQVGNPDQLLGSYAFNGTTGSITNSFAAPSSGSYYYLVEGNGTGSLGGFYSLTSTALPEPQSWSMLLAGALAGFTIYRRNKSK